MKDIIEIMIPITRTIMSRFSSNGEKSENRNINGLITRRVMMIAIPPLYGTGARHFRSYRGEADRENCIFWARKKPHEE